jgi:hypothetical protein
MKHFFIVSLAIGIFSGATTSTLAQTSVNRMRLNDEVTEKIPARFTDGIRIANESPGRSGKENSRTGNFINSIESCTPLQFKFAQLMNVDVESIASLCLFEFIDEWWGTRYWFGGRSKRGIDCSALTGALLYQVYGIIVPRTARAQYAMAEKLNRDELKEGDLVFFNTRGGVSHVGVYLGNGYFTHASTQGGVTINSLDESYYSARFIGGGRITADACTTVKE